MWLKTSLAESFPLVGGSGRSGVAVVLAGNVMIVRGCLIS